MRQVGKSAAPYQPCVSSSISVLIPAPLGLPSGLSRRLQEQRKEGSGHDDTEWDQSRFGRDGHGGERKRAVAAATIGSALEWYDFIVYSFFAAMIGKLFFPSSLPNTQLLIGLATFGVGFFMRPLGAIVLGIYGDRQGRRAALSLTISLMVVGLADPDLRADLQFGRRSRAGPGRARAAVPGFFRRRRIRRHHLVSERIFAEHRRGIYVSLADVEPVPGVAARRAGRRPAHRRI